MSVPTAEDILASLPITGGKRDSAIPGNTDLRPIVPVVGEVAATAAAPGDVGAAVAAGGATGDTDPFVSSSEGAACVQRDSAAAVVLAVATPGMAKYCKCYCGYWYE